MKKEEYTKLNNSFSKRLVFRLGDNAGLFSEINNMFFSMVWALDNKVKFELCSHYSNLGKYGWDTFFEPFTTEVEDDFLFNNNHRFHKLAKVSTADIKKYKADHHIDFFTQDMFSKVFENKHFINKHFEFPELSVSGDSFISAGKLAQSLFIYNKATQEKICTFIQSLSLPENYIAIQVRYGDIKTECFFRHQDLLSPDVYAQKIRSINPDVKNIFVFTDDYRVIPELQYRLPEYKIYTLCRQNEQGFIYKDFIKLSENEKQNELVKVLANIEICKNSYHFIGTRISNPSWFLNFIMEPNRISFVDCKKLIWQTQYNEQNKKVYVLKLFGILPIFQLVKKVDGLNFGIGYFPFYSIKKKNNALIHYLFGFVPLFKLKEK